MKSSRLLGKFFTAYYRSPNHPFKLRLFYFMNRMLAKLDYRLTVPYCNNKFISLNISDYVDRVIFQKGEYEKEVFEELFAFSTENEVLWDIGAHIGSFSLKALSKKNIEQIHCFEPNPETFKCLVINKQLNADDRLHLHNFGLGESKKNIPYFAAKNGNSGGGGFNTEKKGEKGTPLPVNTIDDLVFSNSIAAPTLIKIDVEGFEADVFKGGKKTFEMFPPKAVIFESEALDGKLKNDEIAAFFTSHNYLLKIVECEDEQGGTLKNFLAIKSD